MDGDPVDDLDHAIALPIDAISRGEYFDLMAGRDQPDAQLAHLRLDPADARRVTIRHYGHLHVVQGLIRENASS